MATKLILDVDTGTDDAIAIMAAALHPELELVAVTTVTGNVELPYTTDNTLRVLDYIGADIPVYAGAARPLVRPDFPVPRKQQMARYTEDLAGGEAGDAHPMHGLHLELPEATSTAQDRSAVDFLVDYYLSDAGPHTVLMPVGPLTNIAAAIAVEPRIIERIPKLVIMGGGHAVSNITPAAEFNIWADPEAARVVLNAGIADVVLVPLDATHAAAVSDTDCEAFAALGTPAGEAANTLISRRIRVHDMQQPLARPHTAAVHDALCVAYLIDPQVLVGAERCHVDIEVHGELTVGRTVIDNEHRHLQEPNATVALDGDSERFVAFLTEAFSRTWGAR